MPAAGGDSLLSKVKSPETDSEAMRKESSRMKIQTNQEEP